MQQKIVTLTNEEAAVVMAALNARRVYYKGERLSCDNKGTAALLGDLEQRAGELFLRVANAPSYQPLPLARVNPLRRFWLRITRKKHWHTLSAA